MKHFPYLFAGIFATFALSWIALAIVPQVQLGNLQPRVEDEGADIYPINYAGTADAGKAVYAANGCFYCHTQQVRSQHQGSDLARGWGARRTVALDYLYDDPVFLGTTRNGPDLAAIGAEQHTAEWHYSHLYNSQTTAPGSNMPPFRYLFEKRKISGERAADALNLTGAEAPPSGYQIVPGYQAKALVTYLMSLDKTAHPLKEIKEPDDLAPPGKGEAKPGASPAAGGSVK